MGSNKVATAVVFDVSTSTNHVTDNGQTCFQRAKWCLERIVLRKIFSHENDEIGLILIGSECSNNRLFNEAEYADIHEHTPLRIPNWDFLNKVESLEMSSKEQSDWVEGFVVGLNFLKEESKGKRFKDWQLVVFSNFAASQYPMSKLEPLISIVQDQKVNVVFIGADLKEEVQVMFKFISLLDTGIWLSFKDAEEEFQFYEKKRKMKRLTKVTLDIGVKIKIPMKWMKLTVDETRITWSKQREAATAPQASHSSQIAYKTETDVVEYVKFGGTKVFLSYADQEALKRKSGPAVFSYLGSVKKQRINRAMLTGEEIHVAVPDGTPKSHALVSALIDALLAENKFGIARRILTNNGKIYLGLLLPVSDELGKALYFVRLPFSDCIKSVLDRPLPSEKDEKLSDLIDGYIDSKMLDDEAKVLLKDPSFQHRCHILYNRAKGEDEEIPFHIQSLYDPFPELNSAAETHVAELNQNFYIKYTESGKNRLLETKYVQEPQKEDEVKENMEIEKLVENLNDHLSDDDLFDLKIDTQTQSDTQKLMDRF